MKNFSYSYDLHVLIKKFATEHCLSIQATFCKFNAGDLDILTYVQNSFLPVA